jgi:hypothetical protein
LELETEVAYLKVRFEVLTAVVMMNSVFWDIVPCNPVNVNLRFGKTFGLILSFKSKTSKNKDEVGSKPSSA